MCWKWIPKKASVSAELTIKKGQNVWYAQAVTLASYVAYNVTGLFSLGLGFVLGLKYLNICKILYSSHFELLASLHYYK